MMSQWLTLKALIRGAIRRIGFDLVRYRPPADLSSEERKIFRRVASYTMTSKVRQVALIEAVRYLVRQGVGGCFVECGVWRGGSMMAVALTLTQEGQTTRDLYLYDTFEGMTTPTSFDRKTTDGTSAETLLDRKMESGEKGWCFAGIHDVRKNMASTGYPNERIHFIKGPVEETIPKYAPTQDIALLRLDTDWYESTKHELTHLFPRLCEGGILIIDDYGSWEGQRKAVDEYLAGLTQKFYMHRIDNSARLLIKK